MKKLRIFAKFSIPRFSIGDRITQHVKLQVSKVNFSFCIIRSFCVNAEDLETTMSSSKTDENKVSFGRRKKFQASYSGANGAVLNFERYYIPMSFTDRFVKNETAITS